MSSVTAGGPIQFFSAWFCPYAQRVWMTLNHLQVRYQLIEALTLDRSKEQLEEAQGYLKHPRLLELNPKGLVPTLELETGDVVFESIDAMKFLAERYAAKERAGLDCWNFYCFKSVQSIGSFYGQYFYASLELSREKNNCVISPCLY